MHFPESFQKKYELYQTTSASLILKMLEPRCLNAQREYIMFFHERSLPPESFISSKIVPSNIVHDRSFVVFHSLSINHRRLY